VCVEMKGCLDFENEFLKFQICVYVCARMVAGPLWGPNPTSILVFFNLSPNQLKSKAALSRKLDSS